MILKAMIKGFLWFCIIITTIIWAAWIIAAILRGYEFHEVYQSIVTGTLCLLLWLMVRHNDHLTEERDAWHRAYNDLLNRVMEEVSKGKDLTDLAVHPKKNPNHVQESSVYDGPEGVWDNR